jgi:hypothetical protein
LLIGFRRDRREAVFLFGALVISSPLQPKADGTIAKAGGSTPW